MKARIKKTASRGVPPSPVPHRPWQDSVDDLDLHLAEIVDSEEEEAVVDLWLEEPQSFNDGLETPNSPLVNVRRIKTGGTGLRRYDPMTKAAAASSWDEDFENAKNHAAEVLKNIL